MHRHFTALGLVAALTLGFAPHALAADPTRGAPAAAAPAAAPHASPRSLALARRYFELVEFEDTFNDLMEVMLGPLLEQEFAGAGDMTPAQRDAAVASVREAMAAMMPDIMDGLAEMYANRMTEAQLADTVAFFESPAGRALQSTSAHGEEDFNAIFTRMEPRLEAEIASRLCRRIRCEGAMRPRSS